MNRRHGQTVCLRVGVAAYFIATLLLPQGLVYCQSADGHTAIERAHNSCPEAFQAGGTDNGSLHAFLHSDETCVDTSLMLPVVIMRTTLDESFSLLIPLANVTCINSSAISADGFSNSPRTDRYSQRSCISPADVLRTTILLI